MMPTLDCPSCKTPFVAANLDLSLGIGSCSACGTVHDLKTRRGTQQSLTRTATDPTGIRVTAGPTPKLDWNWRNASLLFVVPFAVFWCGLVGTGVIGMLGRGQWGELLFVIPHSLVGVALAYGALALLLNETTVAVGPKDVSLSHGPLPWWGGSVLSRSDIAQFYLVEVRGNKGSLSYTVWVEQLSGHRAKVLTGLSAGRARFVEDWLERELNIVDRSVDGEHA